jgi:NodT family efflux transporter outer membrane factor (OMF) lipoprotein
MSWELDVFGQTRREVEASTASIQGEEEKRRGTLVTLLGDLGSDYASLRATQARLRIAERNIAVGKQILDFTRERSDHGLASELDVAEADAQVHELQSVVPDFQAAIAQQEFAIAELLGQEPDALQDELRQDDLAPDSRLLAPLPRLPAEIPSEVIRNRPDVRAAERQLASATATIGIAESAYFPKFTIDPSLDLNAGWLHRMLDVGAMAWAVPASISMPVFDSGKISAEVSLAKTYAAAELIAYQKTVLTAFQEVETALSGYQAATAKATSLEGAADADQIALDRATDLYKNGLGDFITVLENEKSLYSAQDALTENRLALSLQTIALYKALGSGWQSLPDVPPAKPRQWP